MASPFHPESGHLLEGSDDGAEEARGPPLASATSSSPGRLVAAATICSALVVAALATATAVPAPARPPTAYRAPLAAEGAPEPGRPRLRGITTLDSTLDSISAPDNAVAKGFQPYADMYPQYHENQGVYVQGAWGGTFPAVIQKEVGPGTYRVQFADGETGDVTTFKITDYNPRPFGRWTWWVYMFVVFPLTFLVLVCLVAYGMRETPEPPPNPNVTKVAPAPVQRDPGARR